MVNCDCCVCLKPCKIKLAKCTSLHVGFRTSQMIRTACGQSASASLLRIPMISFEQGWMLSIFCPAVKIQKYFRLLAQNKTLQLQPFPDSPNCPRTDPRPPRPRALLVTSPGTSDPPHRSESPLGQSGWNLVPKRVQQKKHENPKGVSKAI